MRCAREIEAEAYLPIRWSEAIERNPSTMLRTGSAGGAFQQPASPGSCCHGNVAPALAMTRMASLLPSFLSMEFSDQQISTGLRGSESSADLKVEKMIAEIGSVIRSAAPAQRGELKELAETLLREEVSSIPEETRAPPAAAGARSSNPLFAGILLTILGLAFFLLFPFVGAALGAIGVGLMIWGAVLSGIRK